jgi:short-subunit dehydrogenase
VRAVVELTRAFVPAMIERGGGAVLNVVSMSAFQPVPFLAVYAASKAFVLSMAESMATELEGTGVTVQALCPGNIPTEFQQVAGTSALKFNKTPATTPREVVEASLAALDRRQLLVIPGLGTGSRSAPSASSLARGCAVPPPSSSAHLPVVERAREDARDAVFGRVREKFP